MSFSLRCVWPSRCHLIGKDIIWFHCVIWPAILLACGIALPRAVLAHGFVHGADGLKMSKSLGNVVDPYDVLKRFSVDAFRYFLVRDSPFGGDVTFSEDAMKLRYEGELADTYGNLVNRGLTLCDKFCGSVVPEEAAEQIWSVAALVASVEAAFAAYALHTALEKVMGALNDANKYVTDAEPWHMKEGDPKRRVVVRTVLEAVYVCTHLLQPYLVQAAPKVFAQLATPPVPISSLGATLDHLTPGTKTVAPTKGDVLFQKEGAAAGGAKGGGKEAKGDKAAASKEAQDKARAEKAARTAALQAKQAEQRAAAKEAKEGGGGGGGGGGDEVPVSKLSLVVGAIVSVEKHPSADALYVEQVDLGEASGPRQVVSGLVKYVPMDQMAGRKVVVVANMKPSKLKGVESQAMVLCAFSGDGGAAELLAPPEGCAPGDKVSVEGAAGEAEAVLNPKKKQWEAIQPHLATDAAGLAAYKGKPFQTAKGPVRAATLCGCTIK